MENSIQENSPDKKLDSSDKGDEILKRYRYQITYSAILSLSLIDANSDTQEIFCEHFEDVLIKLKNGKFIGVQVKTKDLDLGPFQTSDPEIEKTIVKFVKLDSQFENAFSSFTIVSNTGFFGSTNTFKNLSYLIDLAKNNKIGELLKNRSSSKSWIRRISKKSKCDEHKVISVLSKIKLEGKKAGLGYITLDLKERLNKIDKLHNQTSGVLNSICNDLILKHFYASSLLNEPQVTESFLSSKTPQAEKVKRILDCKIIKPSDIWIIINKCIEEPISLLLKD
ncbi:MAG: dsDNA nuclease domain-containing protein, partial [Candidatus Hodarchaeota archaeon]